MMDKLASDAYSEGAYQALSQMNIPGHIKQAAAAHLTKTASVSGSVTALGKPGLLQRLKMFGDSSAGVQRGLELFGKGNKAGRLGLSAEEAAKQLLKDRIAAGAVAAGGIGTGAAYGMGAFDDDEGLSNAQIAGLAALGVGGAGLAAHQAGLLG